MIGPSPRRVTVMLAGSAARAAEDKTSREYRSRARAFVAFMSEHRGNGIEKLSQKPRIIQYCEQNIAKMHDFIYLVLSNANWRVDDEVNQALKSVAQSMEEASPAYKSTRLVSPQITQQ